MARGNLSMDQTPKNSGLSLAFAYRGTPVAFPLQANSISPRHLLGDPLWTRLAACEQLWLDGHLVDLGDDTPGTYLLPWAHYFLLSSEDRHLAGLPEPTIPEVSLTARGTVVQPNFRIVADVRTDGIAGNLLHWGKRSGPWIAVGTDGVVLDQRAFQLLDLLSAPVESDFDARVAFLAEVKELAESLHARMDGYLSSEDYRLVVDLDLDLSMDEPDRIDFDVIYRNDGVSPSVLQALQDIGYVEKREGMRRERTIVPKRTREQRAEVQRALPVVQGQDVPGFLLNPEAFLPENLPFDLSRFSERVKGLKRRVYRAQPFISADPKDRGWFALEGQVRVMGSETDDGPPMDVLTPGQVKSLLEAQPDADFVPFHGGWLDVRSARPDTLGSLEEASEMGPVSLDRLPFVLDIFTNLEAIEFDRPLRDVLWTDHALEDGVPALPPLFEGSLHDYQHYGFAFMANRHEKQWGVLLADEMGLGKTVQVIAFLTWLKEQAKHPVLIVAPVALLETWSEEIRRFAPHVRAAAHYGAGRPQFVKVPDDVDVVLSTYDTVARDQLMLAQVDWECVILDEAQQIKNSSTARAEAVKALKNKSRVALTGTPVENSLSDLWALVDFVQPGFLGSLKGFRAQYELKSASGRQAAEHVQRELTRSLKPIYLRRTKDEVKIHLPNKQVQRICVPMGDEQRRAYRQIVGLVQQKQEKALGALRQLQEILGHPWASQDSANWGALPPIRIPKLKATLDILSQVKRLGEKALVFTPSLRLQRMLQYWVMEALEVVPLMINGQSPDRQYLVSQFNAIKGFSVMIATPKSAGVGLTITGANHVIHYTRWWNPAVEKQATDRVHRIGQTRPVTVYYPIVVDEQHRITEKGTVEEILDELLSDKQALADNVVVPSDWLTVDQELLARTFR